MKYKIGEKVKLKPNGRYEHQRIYNAKDGIGTITGTRENKYYEIKFESGYRNSYKDIDLILAKINWKRRLR